MEKANLTYEQQWSEKFANAEMAPPPGVWVAIDGQLANQAVAGYKQQADTYRWIAAACLLLLLGAGFLYYGYGDSHLQTEGVAEIPNTTNEQAQTSSAAIASQENENCTFEETENVWTTQKNRGSGIVPINSQKSIVPMLVLSNEDDENQGEKAPSKASNQPVEIYLLTKVENKTMDNSSVLQAWKADHLYGVADLSALDREIEYGTLWAGVSLSSGSFDPQFAASRTSADFVASPTSNFSSSRQATYEPTYDAGSSISGGVNVGSRVTKRVVLSGGLHYSAFSTGSAESFVATNVNTAERLALTGQQGDVTFSDINNNSYELDGEVAVLNNEFRYLTIPLKAGYVLLDKKFNVTLNTGLSSNILLDASLKQKNQTSQLSNNFGTTNNYESVYFNFISSVEFGYLIQQRYLILVEPNYNQALTNFTNSNSTYQGKPQNFGLSVGVKYNF